MGEMIKAIIFDIGEVLQIDPKGERYEKLSRGFGIPAKEIKNFIEAHRSELWLGKLNNRQFCDLIKEKFGIEKDIIPAWEKVYNEIPLNKEIIKILPELKKNCKLAVISNAHEASSSVRKEKFAKIFEFMIFSCDVGFMKPQKEIFDMALEKLELKPEECVMIDDNEKNLSTPSQMGFKTILFKSNSQLIKELKSLGVEF